jgi:uncharacterized protein (DUF849 family)
MVAGLAVDIAPLIDCTVAGGGHVRVGLEDAAMGCGLQNRTLVEQACARIEQSGGRTASPAEVRMQLKQARHDGSHK